MEYIKKFFKSLYYAFFIEGDTLAQKNGTEISEESPSEENTDNKGE